MTVPSPELFSDVAAEMHIADPSLVEKDFFVTRVLQICMGNVPTGFSFAFAGGTSLSKAYRAIERMSEDIDLKVFPSSGHERLSRNARREALRAMQKEILGILKGSGFEVPADKIKTRNEYQYSELSIPYPQLLCGSESLRPEIKLDLRVCAPAMTEVFPISSFVAQVIGADPEIPAVHCILMDQTAAEKLVAFLRRSADILNGDVEPDLTLVRHAYDLHALESRLPLESFIAIAQQAMESDLVQFPNSGKALRGRVRGEIRATLAGLETSSLFSGAYGEFLGPLVYSQTRPSWGEALGAVSRLASLVWSL